MPRDDEAAKSLPFDLELASDDDLLDELVRRFDHAIFCGIKVESNDQQYYRRKYKGNAATCCGLSALIGDFILDDFNIRGVHVEDDSEGQELGNDDD